jgi:hypothetical protein
MNTTGHANSFVVTDLIQEHQNFWIKVSHIYNTSMTSIAEWKSWFPPPPELSALVTPSPPLENPAATPGEDDGKGFQ